MSNLLYLVHRLPFPPNKGDKVRSYHLLRHLAATHRVFLGTFVDDADDERHVNTVRAMCAGLHVVRLAPRRARIASLAGLVSGEALSVRYYRDAGLTHWIRETAARERIDAIVVFSSSMVQHADALPATPMLVDFVDVDSAKWAQYASAHRGPLAWLYRREGARLLACERQAAARSRRSFFVTANETALFQKLAPECADKVEALSNGVDAVHFAPDAARPSPFATAGVPLVFTGAMDYWPNVDAVTWFVRDMLPALRARWPALHFTIVGRKPTAAVLALASEHVTVTGTVPDVRPYLQHAAVVVAPLRLARGVQNKILEAMAMGRPVVASRACVESIAAEDGRDLLAASEPADFIREIDLLLGAPQRGAAIGAAGRERVLASYSWSAHLAGIDRHLAATLPQGDASADSVPATARAGVCA